MQDFDGFVGHFVGWRAKKGPRRGLSRYSGGRTRTDDPRIMIDGRQRVVLFSPSHTALA